MNDLFLRVGRGLALAGLAGAVAGVVAGGVGSRLAMRVSGIVAGPEMVGRLTENGNRVGDVTLGGTFGLVLFGGLLPGIIGAILYVALGPWLAPLARWRGVGYGSLLLALLGSAILQPTNPDFRRFGPPALNVLTFAALFPLYGVLLAAVADRFEQGAVRNDALAAVGALLSLGVLALGAIGTVGSLTREGEGDAWLGIVFFATLVGALLFRRLLASRPSLRTASYALLALPFVIGGARTVAGVLRLLG